MWLRVVRGPPGPCPGLAAKGTPGARGPSVQSTVLCPPCCSPPTADLFSGARGAYECLLSVTSGGGVSGGLGPGQLHGARSEETSRMTIWFVTLEREKMVTPAALKETVSRRQGVGREPSARSKAKPWCQSPAEARRPGSSLNAPEPLCLRHLPPLPSSWFQTPSGEQCSRASALSPERPCPSPLSPPRRWDVGWGAALRIRDYFAVIIATCPEGALDRREAGSHRGSLPAMSGSALSFHRVTFSMVGCPDGVLSPSHPPPAAQHSHLEAQPPLSDGA